MKRITHILILVILFQTKCFSQDSVTELKFDTKYYQAVDKWVAFPKN